MNTHQLIDRLLNKWPQKIICLLLAIFLYIFHQISLIEKKTFVIPLKVIEDGNVMKIGDCPQTVSVIVRAEADDINSITNSELKASINLNAITQTGEVTVPISITLDDKLMEYDPLEIRLKPEYVTINVDKKISKFVPVMPSISGEVADGYSLTNIEVNPSVVGIIGPESIVNNTTEIQTTALIVSNAEKNFTGEVNYFESNKLISVQDKGPYKVTVSVEPQPMDREFSDIHIVIKNLNENLELENDIPNIDFILSGTVPILKKYLLGVNSVFVDFSEITEPGLYDIPVKINLPSNIHLKKQSFESISVNVIEKAEDNIQSENNNSN